MLFRKSVGDIYKAEDLIILNSGDSIHCEILAVKNQQIIFNLKYHENHIKELRSGLHLGLDAAYYFNESYGIGIAYSSFYTKNEIKNVEFYMEDGSTITGTMGDDINISFIGLMFSQRSLIGHSNSKFIANVGLGSLSYKNDATIVNRIDITGDALGLYACLELDFRVDKNLSLGIGASYVGGTIREVTYDDGTNSITRDFGDNGDNVSRLDLSAGIRIYL